MTTIEHNSGQKQVRKWTVSAKNGQQKMTDEWNIRSIPRVIWTLWGTGGSPSEYTVLSCTASPDFSCSLAVFLH